MTTTLLPHLQLFPAFAGTSNAALRAALKALPDYDEHEAGKRNIAASLAQANAELLKAAHVRIALVQQVAGIARADKSQPSDLTRKAVQSAEAVAHARETATLLQEAERTIAQDRDQVLLAAPTVLMR